MLLRKKNNLDFLRQKASLSCLLICLLLCSCISKDAKSNKNYSSIYGGKWYWKSADGKNTFFVSLKTVKDSVYGYYCAVYDRGNRIDCGSDETDINLKGTINDSDMSLVFASFFGAENGRVMITLNMMDTTLIWRIKVYPSGGNCFAPENAVLTKKKMW